MVAATLAARRRRGKSAPIRRSGFCAEARRKFRGPEPRCGYFEHAPFATVGSLAPACRGQIHGLLTCVIPWWQGKMQGISSNWLVFAKICLENIREFSSFRGKSLRDGAGN